MSDSSSVSLMPACFREVGATGIKASSRSPVNRPKLHWIGAGRGLIELGRPAELSSWPRSELGGGGEPG